MRIYELAKKLGVKSKGILCELSKLGIEGKTHSSNIEFGIVKTLENILLKDNIDHKEADKKERLQALKKLSKNRLSEYLKNEMLDKDSEYVNLWEDRKAEFPPEKEESEDPMPKNDEGLKTDLSDVSSSWQTMAHSYGVKQENIAGHRSIIIGLVISAIFIITVLFFTINYYVLKDKPHERPQTKSLDLPVQEEESRGQVESGISTLPQDNEIVSQPLFTIQVGAFNDAYYAKALKTRLNKKGYHAFIIISFSKKGRFYKVLVGKFSNRRKAEMLSAKIKRAEGIQTFVTLWKKQYL
ncbi:MAG TPA: translation initiation factor IF-2 N-terminal domain-containing protein, partial [Thermodesulfovibrionales bacterium]|nr:translation initiation factor IF-2 N-terminal domain-containing protein [Thermodesulfovibrionales bacterium]